MPIVGVVFGDKGRDIGEGEGVLASQVDDFCQLGVVTSVVKSCRVFLISESPMAVLNP